MCLVSGRADWLTVDSDDNGSSLDRIPAPDFYPFALLWFLAQRFLNHVDFEDDLLLSSFALADEPHAL